MLRLHNLPFTEDVNEILSNTPEKSVIDEFNELNQIKLIKLLVKMYKTIYENDVFVTKLQTIQLIPFV